MLQDVSAALAGSGGNNAPETFQGYRLFGSFLDRREYVLDASFDAARHASPGRSVGVARNRILAGLLLHQQRVGAGGARPRQGSAAAAACGGRHARDLAVGCESATGGGAVAGAPSPRLGGIGIDPVFSRRSQLYRSDLVAGESP